MSLLRLHLRLAPAARLSPVQTRTFLTSSRLCEKEHVTNKQNQLDIQSDAHNKGQKARANDQADAEGPTSTKKSSAATSQQPTSASKQAEAEHGRKDRGMGLQDERGGKGH